MGSNGLKREFKLKRKRGREAELVVFALFEVKSEGIEWIEMFAFAGI